MKIKFAHFVTSGGKYRTQTVVIFLKTVTNMSIFIALYLKNTVTSFLDIFYQNCILLIISKLLKEVEKYSCLDWTERGSLS